MSFIWNRKLHYVHNHFKGRFFNIDPGVNWANFIPIENRPINYLEIGAADGGSAILVSKSYCKNPESKIYCVDPWFDYDDYPEYKGVQDNAWINFNHNIETSGSFGKFIVNRGLSGVIVPKFKDEFFDIIYVDGNHETEYVYKDGLMAFQKAKKGGYIVFDDYNDYWPQTMKGIDQFLVEYSEKLRILTKSARGQVIVQKI
jgi:hypothetical protein